MPMVTEAIHVLALAACVVVRKSTGTENVAFAENLPCEEYFFICSRFTYPLVSRSKSPIESSDGSVSKLFIKAAAFLIALTSGPQPAIKGREQSINTQNRRVETVFFKVFLHKLSNKIRLF